MTDLALALAEARNAYLREPTASEVEQAAHEDDRSCDGGRCDSQGDALMADPLDQYLAAACLTARWRGKATNQHPVRCRLCAIPIEELERVVSAPVDAGAVTAWRRLSNREREERIRAAQVDPEEAFLLDL